MKDILKLCFHQIQDLIFLKMMDCRIRSVSSEEPISIALVFHSFYRFILLHLMFTNFIQDFIPFSKISYLYRWEFCTTRNEIS